MNISERLVWVVVIALGGFYIDRQNAKIDNLESLNDFNDASKTVQNDYITDLRYKIDEVGRAEYSRGIEEGKNRAMIATINGEGLDDYKQGYHAAINQLTLDQELTNHSYQNSQVYDLFLQLLEMNEENSDRYLEVVDILTSD